MPIFRKIILIPQPIAVPRPFQASELHTTPSWNRIHILEITLSPAHRAQPLLPLPLNPLGASARAARLGFALRAGALRIQFRERSTQPSKRSQIIPMEGLRLPETVCSGNRLPV
jgi:hypothetical protein